MRRCIKFIFDEDPELFAILLSVLMGAVVFFVFLVGMFGSPLPSLAISLSFAGIMFALKALEI